MTDALGVLVVGAGDMGSRHALAWQAAGARVVGLVDPDVGRAAQAADRVGARVFRDLPTGLSDPGVHAVSICTPTFLHADQAVAALEAGKDVLCEKPAALTLPEAERMQRAEAASARRLRIGFMRRFDPASHRIHAFCSRLGQPLLAQTTIAAGIRPKLLMHDARANGGPIIDMCCHLFDGWAQLLGERPERVRAHGYTFGQDKVELAAIAHKAVDSAFVTLEYPSGAVGQIQVSWGLPRGVPATEAHVYLGPAGIVTVDWPRAVVLRDASGETRYAPSVALDPWTRQIHAFCVEIRGGPPGGLARIDDGIAALRTSLAVLESVASDREVRVDEVRGDLPDVSPPAEVPSA